MPGYPERLQAIIDFFESLPEDERRENLIAYAEQVAKYAPPADQKFDLEDIRKDEGCTDTVGIFLRLDAEERVHFCVTLGPQVQTLTKALATILCRGLDGCTIAEILELPSDFVPRIVGAQLVRIRSQTVYYILTRMKEAVRMLRDRQRGGE